MSGRGSSRGGGGYKVLCVSCLHPKASDDVIRESLYREYNKKYGDVSVRVMHEPDERVAYVYFRNFDDARDAKHAKSRIILFDKPAVVEPVYENRRRSPSPGAPMPSYGGYGGGGGGGARYRSRSPLLEHRHSRSDYHPVSHHRDGGGGGDYPSSPYERPPNHHHQHHNVRRGGYPYESRQRYSKDNRVSEAGVPPPPPHHHQHHHAGSGGGGAAGSSHHLPPSPASNNSLANKKDKFPNYLNHIPPEDDPLSTRTLFTGNLELNITEEEMRRIFGRYGKLVDIDIKRPPPGTGNAYAFIRYENLDQAHRAKIELSGQYIGKFQCKIGYGKVNPTPKVWVGGLGSWASSLLLESEFDRFGAIQKVDYRKGDPHAYIYFESIEAAQAAVQEMRGYPLGGQDKRLRMDFADMEETTPGERFRESSSSSTTYAFRGGERGYSGGGGGGGGGARRPPYASSPGEWSTPGGSKRPPPLDDDLDAGDLRPSRIRRLGSSPEPGEDEEDPRRPPIYGEDEEEAGGVRSLMEITKKTPNVWDGGLILKNSLFPTKFYLIEGNEDVVDCLKDESDKPHLKITQRLRLDQGKLDDVSKRMKTSSAHAIFLGVSDSNELTHENPDIQSRPLRNLVTYLKQKEAAGVISLGGGGKDEGAGGGVLYCFPPCDFSLDLLRREFSNIDEGGIKEDHLVIVVVCGN